MKQPMAMTMCRHCPTSVAQRGHDLARGVTETCNFLKDRLKP